MGAGPAEAAEQAGGHARTYGGVLALDEQLQEMERRLQCQARQSHKRRLRKLMEPAKSPERALTLCVMEQIQYRCCAFPKEWPDYCLVQGFGMMHKVIHQVLKSHFCPLPEQALKQGASTGSHPSPAPTCGVALSLLSALEFHPDCRKRGRPPPGAASWDSPPRNLQ